MRRQFLKSFALATLASQFPFIVQAKTNPKSLLKPPRLKVGDTVGLITPGSYISPEDVEQTKQAMASLGLNVKLGNHILDRYGYLGGKDSDRAGDVNAMFADNSVQAIIATRGGWGCNRILPMLDYRLIRQYPKILMGFSDITSLLLAIYTQSKVVTFHGPVATSSWDKFTLDYVQKILFNAEAVTLENSGISGSNLAISTVGFKTITAGKTRGKLIGGNLSVLVAMVGSSYLPDWKNTILFIEEIGEEVYRIDRMLTHLKLAGILNQISGFIFGQCTKCEPKGNDDSLTLTQVLQDHIQPLGIPAWYGSRIGHVKDKFTLPIGIDVEIDASVGSIKMIEAAVSRT